jgi:general L-amino acid transport system permease protein
MREIPEIATDTQEPLPSEEEPLGPPIRELGPREWVKQNLFNSWYNTLLTILLLAILSWVTYKALWFVFVSARWEVIRVNLTLLMVGRFPRGELWRLWTALAATSGVLGVAWGMVAGAAREQTGDEADQPKGGWTRRIRNSAPLLLAMAVVLSLARTLTPALLLLGTLAAGLIGRRAGMLVPGSYRRFAPAVGVLGIITFFQTISGFGGVGWNQWGGLLLTILLAVGGIAISFPIGILLALGRRSSLRVVQVVSVAYIELIRGVPLITLLFMGAFVIGFFFPPGITPGLATRALIALVMFTAAYVAEIVRGGLQAVPRGQYEAGQAVGLSPYKVTRLVVLPQALRAVIPAIVGQFISLFKDTSLVVTIGLLDLLAVSESVTSQPQFLAQGLHAETLGFAAFLYWAGSYWMSRSSQRLEKRLGVGER